MIYERFKRYDLRHFWGTATRSLSLAVALIQSYFLVAFMDVIASISTYSMPNWLCNDLTEMADQLMKKFIFRLVDGGGSGEKSVFFLLFKTNSFTVYWTRRFAGEARASIFINCKSIKTLSQLILFQFDGGFAFRSPLLSLLVSPRSSEAKNASEKKVHKNTFRREQFSLLNAAC